MKGACENKPDKFHIIYKIAQIRSLSTRPVWPVLKWNARVPKIGSDQKCPTHGSEPLSSPAPVRQSAGIWRAAGQMEIDLKLKHDNE